VLKLQLWFGDNPGVHLHHNPVNQGIAASLNKGITIASQAGYDWVLTLDDDTTVAPDMVETLIAWWSRLAGEAVKSIAVMGMSARDPYHGQAASRSAGSRQAFVEKRHLVTSGCLMSLEAYRAIGPFREEFFIDWVDYDYCRAQGFSRHQLSRGHDPPAGRVTEHRFWRFKVITSNYPPFRRYYWYRNF
jgi:rhamnosyltransferase